MKHINATLSSLILIRENIISEGIFTDPKEAMDLAIVTLKMEMFRDAFIGITPGIPYLERICRAIGFEDKGENSLTLERVMGHLADALEGIEGSVEDITSIK